MEAEEVTLSAAPATAVITARVPAEDADAFRAQAARFSLRPSQAVAALVAGALAVEPNPQVEVDAHNGKDAR